MLGEISLVRKLTTLCKSQSSENMIARVYPQLNKIFQHYTFTHHTCKWKISSHINQAGCTEHSPHSPSVVGEYCWSMLPANSAGDRPLIAGGRRPLDLGADVHPWLSVFSTTYPFLEELRLKRMVVSDENL
ncbi:hypothetical protein L6452_09186 [Arctium lappa]|uniref:Uncharacterized protein n=1 Tax=Arctium lappa TaxID=4217 RepID=A0ACB9DJN5_ARCLA|nr:hypothetical protein L6452_09186 [Arctium lappa]